MQSLQFCTGCDKFLIKNYASFCLAKLQSLSLKSKRDQCTKGIDLFFFRFTLWNNHTKQIPMYTACETFYRKGWLACYYCCKLIVEVVKHLWGFGCLVTWLGSSPDGKTVTLNYGTTDVYCLQLTRISLALSLSLSQMLIKNKHFKRKLPFSSVLHVSCVSLKICSE